MASYHFDSITRRHFRVLRGRDLQTSQELCKVIRETILDQSLSSARFIELDMINLAIKHFGERFGNLFLIRYQFRRFESMVVK